MTPWKLLSISGFMGEQYGKYETTVVKKIYKQQFRLITLVTLTHSSARDLSGNGTTKHTAKAFTFNICPSLSRDAEPEDLLRFLPTLAIL